jgi:hypothetical protein
MASLGLDLPSTTGTESLEALQAEDIADPVLEEWKRELQALKAELGRSVTPATSAPASLARSPSKATDMRHSVRRNLAMTMRTASAVGELDDLLDELSVDKAGSSSSSSSSQSSPALGASSSTKPPHSLPPPKKAEAQSFGGLTLRTAAAVDDLDDLLGELHTEKQAIQSERDDLLQDLDLTRVCLISLHSLLF